MQIKLCIDCQYYRIDSFGKPRYGRCARNDLASPVDGSHAPYDDLTYCATERKEYSSIDTCRIEAKYFVAKEQSGSPFNIEPLPLRVNLESNHV